MKKENNINYDKSKFIIKNEKEAAQKNKIVFSKPYWIKDISKINNCPLTISEG